MSAAIQELRAYPSDRVHVFHHNDTDGLTSGAILYTAFSRAGYQVERYALEKPYPDVLEQIFSLQGHIIVLADFAGKIAPLISQMNQEKNLVLIIDHHPAEASGSPKVYTLDGDLYGLKGDRDISASATSFLFATVLNPANGDLAHLGTLGAIGDGFFVDGKLSGYNRQVMQIARDQNLLEVRAKESVEEYLIQLGGLNKADKLCTILDTLGGVGYYEGGPEKGLALCLKGSNEEIESTFELLLNKRDQIFKAEIERLRAGKIHETEHLQWFDVEERFRPMGVKMIGVFCTVIRDLDFLDHRKYLAGFQSLPNEVPGFGAINFQSKKISMRVSSVLTAEIRSGHMPGLSEFLPTATLNLGGFADACHSLSAATTVKIGDENKLIQEMEKVLKSI